MQCEVSTIRLVFLGLLAVSLLATAGCDDSTSGVIDPACMTFTAAAAPSAGAVVARDGAGSSCDVALVEVVATDINGVYSASWVVDYDNTFLIFSGLDVSDSHLASDGNVLVTNFSDSGGTVTFGVARNGSQSTDPVDFTGTQLVATVFFTRLVSNGNSTVSFRNEDLFDNDQPPVALNTAPWSGGTLTIN